MTVSWTPNGENKKYDLSPRTYAQCFQKGGQADNFIYNFNTYFLTYKNFLELVVIVLITHIQKKKQKKNSNENVLLLTHCAYVRTRQD